MWTKQGWRYWEKRYEHDLKKEKEEKEQTNMLKPPAISMSHIIQEPDLQNRL
jgi:hypothetical protein